MENAVLVALGGALGASARYLVSSALADSRYPIPTLVVNTLGSVLVGLLFGIGVTDQLTLFVVVGFGGALTTYSTFSVDTVRLWDESPRQALYYAVGTLVACLFAFGVAYGIGSVIAS